MRSTHARCRTAVAKSTSRSRRLSAARFVTPNPLRALVGDEARPKMTSHPAEGQLADARLPRRALAQRTRLAELQHELAEHRHGQLGGRRSARQSLLAKRARVAVGARGDLHDAQRAAAAGTDQDVDREDALE